MSDAIDYLKAVRPEAVDAYFTFLRKSGEHLDNKTRFLISVITKVDNQTEKGFRQYLKRALKEGNTANEIIDALLVAFPTLGLTKIIWAVEQISAMGLPEFNPENLAAKSDWHDVMDVDALTTGVNYTVVDEMPMFINKDSEQIKVYEARCPHKKTLLTLDDMKDNCLECPTHLWKFDMMTGDCVEGGNEPMKQLKSRVSDGVLQASW